MPEKGEMRRRYELYLRFADLMAGARRDRSFRPKDLAGICAEKPERDFSGREVLSVWEAYPSALREDGSRHRLELGVVGPQEVKVRPAEQSLSV